MRKSACALLQRRVLELATVPKPAIFLSRRSKCLVSTNRRPRKSIGPGGAPEGALLGQAASQGPSQCAASGARYRPAPVPVCRGVATPSYLIRVNDKEAVLRCPPIGELSPGAYEMGRESQILGALGSCRTPCICAKPRMIGQCVRAITGAQRGQFSFAIGSIRRQPSKAGSLARNS